MPSGANELHGGLGVGLTLVKTLAELHGGTVEAISAGPGRGSEVHRASPGLQQPGAERSGRLPGAGRSARKRGSAGAPPDPAA